MLPRRFPATFRSVDELLDSARHLDPDGDVPMLSMRVCLSGDRVLEVGGDSGTFAVSGA
jgi:hypothetical protein